jgi:hypothetical protein
MNNLETLDTRMNEMIRAGKILEALDEFYADDAQFQEGNTPPRIGKRNHREFLVGFLGSLKAFNGATLHSQAIGTNVTLTEWTFDLVGPHGPILWNEVLRRTWRDGKVVSERYYTAT